MPLPLTVKHLRGWVPSWRSTLLSLFAIASLVLLVDRYKASFVVTYDMGIQLNAAENFLATGKPLADHFTPQGPDLCLRSESPSLTWFPPGFSMGFAAFRASGLSPSLALKVYDVTVLGLGLLGWGLVLGSITRNPPSGPLAAKVLACLAVTCLPFALCPWSGGTDSFLWASTAWCLYLLKFLVSSEKWFWPSLLYALLTAVAICFRYAALYLVLLFSFALLLLLPRKTWTALKAGFVFGVGLLLGLVPLLLYNAKANSGSVAPPYTYENPFKTEVFLRKSQEVLTALSKANSLWGSGKYDDYLEFSGTSQADKITSGLILLVLLVSLTLYSAKSFWNRDRQAPLLWPYLLAAAVLSLITFLVIPSFGTGYNSISDGRYYMPLLPALPLACLALLVTGQVNTGVRLGASAILAVFTLETLFLKTPSNQSFPLNYSHSRASCEGASLWSWLKSGESKLFTKPIAYDLSLHFAAHEGRAIFDRLRLANPEALFFVQEQPYFHFDKAKARLLGIPDQYFWNEAFVSKDSDIYIFSSNTKREIISSLYKTPVTISNHLKISVLQETPYWTVFHLHAPAGTKLIR